MALTWQITNAFGSLSTDGNYNPDADFNNNGYVDESDLTMFAEHLGRTDCPISLQCSSQSRSSRAPYLRPLDGMQI